MRLTDFKVLTFDCYGTLIDWETGIYEALKPLLTAANSSLGRDAALAAFAKHESDQEAATPRMVYYELLATVHRRLARDWDADIADAAHQRFGDSVGEWPAFPDSAAA